MQPADKAVIQASQLTKRYGAAITALDQLTVTVEPGITGLIGANGAGKSTLIKILLGLLGPTSGHAAVFGLDCVTRGFEIRTITGYMPEHDCLSPDVTATEFVTHMGRMSGLPATAARERAADSLRHVGLYEERYRQIGTYSTGMKQRVKLAQALVGDPRLLLLDEPTNGLDPAGRSAMLDLIARIGTEFGISILVASHLLGEIEQICDHLVAIDGGRLLRADSVSSVTQASAVLLVEVDEGLEELQAELGRRSLRPIPYQRGLLIQLAGDETYDAIRDAIADLGLPLSRLEQRRHRIEELFRADPTVSGEVGSDVWSADAGQAPGLSTGAASVN
ncbi:MAG TPA: ABC transporter ATP-binding protein [Streptosporangiaceae bacterium]|nr:ABC transporter ATP-binding protein [Streptosporangiaceae bacterium]